MSPFENLGKILNLLNFVGSLPFLVKYYDGKPKFVYQKSYAWKFPLIIIVCFFTNMTFKTIIGIVDLKGQSFNFYVERSGFSIMDFYTFSLGSVACGSGSFLTAIAFMRKKDQIIRFNYDFHDLITSNDFLYGLGSITCKKSFWRMASNTLLCIISIMIIPLSLYLEHDNVFEGTGNQILKWAFVASGLVYGLGFTSPVVAGAYGLSLHLVMYTGEAFQSLKSCLFNLKFRMKSAKSMSKVAVVHDMTVLPENHLQDEVMNHLAKYIDVGLNLSRLLNDLNKLTSLFLFIFFIEALTIGAIFMYGEFGILFSKVTTYKIVTTLIFTTFSAVHLLALLYICLAGQELQNSMLDVVNELEEILAYLAKENMEDIKIIPDLSLLVKKLNRGRPITPYSYFAVNNATLVKSYATLVTYVIVLLQFKSLERKI